MNYKNAFRALLVLIGLYGAWTTPGWFLYNWTHPAAEAAPAPEVKGTDAIPYDTAIVLPACPPSAGKNPVTQEGLISKMNPYPGVACEYEYVNVTNAVTVTIPAGYGALVADWGVTCPFGPTCEGTWVATTSFKLPAGWLAHVFLYTSREAAEGRFPSFACEYVAQKGHSEVNIRLPRWANGHGTILDHPGCPLP